MITTYLKNQDQNVGDLIKADIKARVQTSAIMQEVNVVELNATAEDKVKAARQNISVGLYVLNRLNTNTHGEIISVGDFFAITENRQKIEQAGEIIKIAPARIRQRISKALDVLQSQGVNVSDLRNALKDSNDIDLKKIQENVREKQNRNKSSTDDPGPKTGSALQAGPQGPVPEAANVKTSSVR